MKKKKKHAPRYNTHNNTSRVPRVKNVATGSGSGNSSSAAAQTLFGP